MDRKLCAVSVDLDPLSAYYSIHGLGEPPPQVLHTIVRCALPRFAELFAAAGVQATFFIVGQDLEQSPELGPALAELAAAGHEIGNHSYSHPYALNRLSAERITQELGRAHELITEAVGAEHAPVGFRAPGYFINRAVLAALVALGYRYDSSMFPSPPYYLAKAAVMLGMSLRGRRSAAVLSDPRALLAPPDPYRPSLEEPWRQGTAPLIELPVAVVPGLRMPAIGTLLTVSPAWLRSALLQSMGRRPLFNLELHGIDLADAVSDSVPTELAGRQPDLRVPHAEKFRILLETLRGLQRDHEFVTLREAALRFSV
ncbi:MAG: polysaccharide deacetylase family protein [Proteobacteria bacterium]|nr:polysaccharide deacetylase family protein [Pseudomonadota bacterium]